MILIDRPERNTGINGDDFDIEFNYDTIQWDTGEDSGGDEHCQNSDTEGNSAYVGYSNGALDHYELPGSGVTNAFLDSTASDRPYLSRSQQQHARPLSVHCRQRPAHDAD